MSIGRIKKFAQSRGGEASVRIQDQSEFRLDHPQSAVVGFRKTFVRLGADGRHEGCRLCDLR
jgi:hypothetical protein